MEKFFAGMKTEGKWNWNEHVLMFRIDIMWKTCTPRWNHTKCIFEVTILKWWKMVIDRRNRCCFFPVDIAEYEKWHLVVAIFCSQKNKPQLFCIECSSGFEYFYVNCLVLERARKTTSQGKDNLFSFVTVFRNILHMTPCTVSLFNKSWAKMQKLCTPVLLLLELRGYVAARCS